MSDSEQESMLNIFEDPPDYYKPQPPCTNASYQLRSGETITVRLVGHNPLWGHLLWNAGRTISNYLEEHAESLIKDKTILELGAGAGVPSLVCAKLGASKVVTSDYPDAELIENLRHNLAVCESLPQPRNIVAEGFLWGSPVSPLLHHLPVEASSAGFDILILADLLFNHSEHEKLIATIEQTLKKTPEARALVFFTPYRPWLLEKDMAFFTLAKDRGFIVEQIMESLMEKVLFDNDPGDETLRRTVFGYEIRWPSTEMDS